MRKNMSTVQSYSGSFTDLQDQLDCTQRSLANLRKHIRIIVKEELQFLFRDFVARQCQVGKEGNTEEVIN